jgi:hypothetical protein
MGFPVMAGIITPATIYVKVVIPAKAGIQICGKRKKWLRYACQEIYKYSTVFKTG